MIKMIRTCAALGLVLVLSGCQSNLMTRASGTSATVSPDEATVVFLRPSSFGGAIQSSVYDVTDGKTQFGGIVSAKTQVSMHVPAGTHLFMVVAENADFMNATLDAGKTYYVLVKPRPGMWKVRFSLIPIHKDAGAEYSLASADFSKWKSKSAPVAKTPAADAWYAQHQADIEAKRLDYMKKWEVMAPEDKATLTLHAEDGV
jgi:hypothetical protein